MTHIKPIKLINKAHKEREIRRWPQEATSAIQDCFETTQCDIIREAATQGGITDLREYTESVIGYVNKSIDDVTGVKPIKRRANQKPWLTGEVCSLLRPIMLHLNLQHTDWQGIICPEGSGRRRGCTHKH